MPHLPPFTSPTVNDTAGLKIKHELEANIAGPVFPREETVFSIVNGSGWPFLRVYNQPSSDKPNREGEHNHRPDAEIQMALHNISDDAD